MLRRRVRRLLDIFSSKDGRQQENGSPVHINDVEAPPRDVGAVLGIIFILYIQISCLE